MIDQFLAKNFTDSFELLAAEFENNAAIKGFWDDLPTKGDKIALMHGELSELLEAERLPEMPMSKKIPEFTESEEEIADLIIRAMDYAYHFGLNVGEAIIAKHSYNTGRPYKHGKKF